MRDRAFLRGDVAAGFLTFLASSVSVTALTPAAVRLSLGDATGGETVAGLRVMKSTPTTTADRARIVGSSVEIVPDFATRSRRVGHSVQHAIANTGQFCTFAAHR